MLTLLPNLPKLLREIEDPRCKESKMLTDEPNLAQLKTLKVLPQRVKERTDKADAKWIASKTLRDDPNLA
jgi:hypothetical protein